MVNWSYITANLKPGDEPQRETTCYLKLLFTKETALKSFGACGKRLKDNDLLSACIYCDQCLCKKTSMKWVVKNATCINMQIIVKD